MPKMGSEYEQFVQKLQQALLDSEQFFQLHNIVVERNKKLIDNAGIEREFDLYWEYELAGITYKTIIECKDYTSKVSIDKIDALVGKINDLPDIKPIFATKIGYQSGAETKAKQHKIELLIVREQNDDDWVDEEGNHLIKMIEINVHILSPVQITKFQPFIDKEWMETNTSLDLSKPLHFSANNNEIFIDDKKVGERYSLFDLGHKLESLNKDHYGKNLAYSQLFEDAYIEYDSVSYKLRAYQVEYNINPPLIETFSMDYAKELIGVIEYLHQRKSTAIFKDRVVKNWRNKTN